jgi:NADH-quinone oxidoreductase subunit L
MELTLLFRTPCRCHHRRTVLARGRRKAAQVIATGLLFLSAALSWWVFLTFDGTAQSIQILRWIDSGTLVGDWAFRLDRLTTVMLIVITTVSALVHLYSFGYMAHDDNWTHHEHYKARFFAYLSLFTFAMLMLVTATTLCSCSSAGKAWGWPATC